MCSTFDNAKSRSKGYRGALHIHTTMTNFYAEKINFWVEANNRRPTGNKIQYSIATSQFEE
jgi:hypothetical protein